MRKGKNTLKSRQSQKVRISRRRALQLGVAVATAPTILLLEAAAQEEPTPVPGSGQVYNSEPPYQPKEGEEPPPPPSSFDTVVWDVLTEDLTRFLQDQLQARLEGSLGAAISDAIEVSRVDLYDRAHYNQPPELFDGTLGEIAKILNEELQRKLIEEYGVPEDEARFAVVGELNLMFSYQATQARNPLSVGVAYAASPQTCTAGWCYFWNSTKSRGCWRCCSLC